MSRNASAPLRLPTLDGWRAVAVMVVIWGHIMPGFYAGEGEYYRQSLSRFGGFGVDVFFGISGLLITKLLLDEFVVAGRISIRAFYVRRAFRILPPCFLYLAAVALTLGMLSRIELASSVFFFRNYIPDALGSSATKHLWSLAVEEHFYLVWPALLTGFILRRGLRGAARKVAWISIGCALWRVLDAAHQFSAPLFPLVPVHFRTDLRMDSLLWGCVAAFLLVDEKAKARLLAGFREWVFFLVLAAALCCIAFYSQLTSLWLAMLIPAGLVGTTLHPEWKVSRLLDHPGLRFIGRMSYSLYLWQQIFLVEGWQPHSVLQTFPQNLMLTFLAALLSYRLLEKPCMEAGHALSARIRVRVNDRNIALPLEPVQLPSESGAQRCRGGHHCPAEGRCGCERRQQEAQIYQPGER